MNPAPASTPTTDPFPPGARAFLLGIGGCGMSGLARMLAGSGVQVAGSDQVGSAVTESLTGEGVNVRVGPPVEGPEAIPDDCSVVVASAAIPADHPEALEAQRRGLPIISYAEALGHLMQGRTGVAIAGTHGKSTTAAMLGVALAESGIDPTVIVGATCRQLSDSATSTGFRLGARQIASGRRAGEPGALVCEACEFNRSFHHLRPTIASIGSVEADHLDIYGSLDAVVEAFHDFARLLPPADQGGTLIIGHDGAHRREVTAGLDCGVETIGFSPAADWQIATDERRITLSHAGSAVCVWTAPLPGEHNAFNSAMAAALAITLGADADATGQALSGFRGVDRRVQFLGDRNGVRVYDDYGHHPTEIDTTLRALRQFERPERHGGRLICVFQPHQHSRTRFLLEEFAQSFSQADIVVVPHIYFVRDSEIEKTKVSAGDLVDRLRRSGVQAMHLYPFEAIVEQLENICRPGDLLVVMGAGPVWEVAHGFIGTRDSNETPAHAPARA